MPGPAGLCCAWISVSFVGMKRFRSSSMGWQEIGHWKMHAHKPLSNSQLRNAGVLELPKTSNLG